MGKIAKGLKMIARAAIAQPWDYQGDGAPNEPEFRLSPDRGYVGIYLPEDGLWRIVRADDLSLAAEATVEEMEANTGDWAQFVSVEDPDA